MVLALAALLLHLAPSADARATIDATTNYAAPSAALTSAAASTPTSAPNHAKSSPESAPSSSPSLADASVNTQTLANIRLPEAQPAKTERIIPVENAPSRRTWIALAVAQHGAAAFDAYTTRHAISVGAHEQDPLMRPFATSPAIYFVGQAGPLALDYVARRMQRSQNLLIRRTWWLPQSASTGLFIFSGVHNLNVYQRLHP